MAKVHKYELYLVDTGNKGKSPKEGRIVDTIENLTGCMTTISKVSESENFEWSDNLKINHVDSTTDDLDEVIQTTKRGGKKNARI